jgi:methylmalonyl-CoA mutase
MPTNLFDEFSSVSLDEWIKKIESDLKGKPLSILDTHPEPDFKTHAYHHGDQLRSEKSDGRTNIDRKQNSWKVRKEFDAKKDANATVLDALNNGVNSIGINWHTQESFDQLTKGVLFEHIDATIHFTNLEEVKYAQFPENIRAVFDPIAINAQLGKHQFSQEHFQSFLEELPNNGSIWVSGYTYGQAGASTIQELAFTIAHLNEYLHTLTKAGMPLEDVLAKIILELSVNENYLLNIAKFRVIHDLFRLLLKGYEYDGENFNLTVFAKTTTRHLALNDVHNNPLRQTTQAMSAIIGGCNSLTIANRTTGKPAVDRRLERLSRNIQLILAEESYLDKVVDPAAGAYAIESICKELVEQSWSLFQEIEDNGGLLASLSNHKIEELIRSNRTALIEGMNTGKNTLLGVNKHPNGAEEWVSPKKPAENSNTFMALAPFELENYFENSTDHE